jgi:hypothetical protein
MKLPENIAPEVGEPGRRPLPGVLLLLGNNSTIESVHRVIIHWNYIPSQTFSIMRQRKQRLRGRSEGESSD